MSCLFGKLNKCHLNFFRIFITTALSGICPVLNLPLMATGFPKSLPMFLKLLVYSHSHSGQMATKIIAVGHQCLPPPSLCPIHGCSTMPQECLCLARKLMYLAQARK